MAKRFTPVRFATSLVFVAALGLGVALSSDGRSASADLNTSVPGDVDCNGIANSVDAAVLLQFVAELLGELGCSQSADLSEYNRVSAIDAALILQYSAGLLDQLATAQGPDPAPKPSEAAVAQLSAGTYFTCALTTSADVRCWGENLAHSIGVQRTCFPLVYSGRACSTVPVDIQGLDEDAIFVSAGTGDHDGHGCVLTSSGSVKCWGYNNWGQLGDGTGTGRAMPVDVLGLATAAVAIATGGDHSCALVDDGDANTTGYAAKCWGENVFGQLGIGITDFDYASAVDVKGLASGVFAISGGLYHTCAIVGSSAAEAEHRVKCWGYNNYGKLGDGTWSEANVPVDVVWDERWGGVVDIAAGGGFTCALTTLEGVKCWGDNGSGQLGDGTTTERYTPVDVIGLTSGVVSITAGGYHACAVTSGRGLKCWGLNASGQLGDGTTTDSRTPVDVIGMENSMAGVNAGFIHTCAWTVEGQASCWGRNSEGQLGDGTTTSRTTPVSVLGLTGAN